MCHSLPSKHGTVWRHGRVWQKNSWLAAPLKLQTVKQLTLKWPPWCESGWKEQNFLVDYLALWPHQGKKNSNAVMGCWVFNTFWTSWKGKVETYNTLHHRDTDISISCLSLSRDRQSHSPITDWVSLLYHLSNYKPEPGLSKNGSLARPICGLKLAPTPQKGALAPSVR